MLHVVQIAEILKNMRHHASRNPQTNKKKQKGT